MKVLSVLGQDVNLKLSPSFMEKANCPLYLKKNYADRIGDKYIRIPAMRGQALHAAIEALVRFTEEEECAVIDITDEQLMDALVENSAREVMEEAPMMIECLTLWRDKWRKSEHIYGYEEKLALDENFEETAWDNGSYRGILDIVDIIDTHCRTTDWKSQPNILSKTDLAAHEQLTHYCWLAWKTYPHLETFSARIWYLRYGFYHETERTIDELKEYEKALLFRERKILEISDWEPVPGKHCVYCDYIHTCPLSSTENLVPLDPMVTLNQEHAIAIAEKLTVMEHWSKAAKERLKDYVKKSGAVKTSDNWIYGLEKSTGEDWDSEKVFEVLEKHGFEPASIANVDKKKLKKLMKEATYENDNPEVEADLNAIVGEKHSTRFKGWKPEA